MQTTTNTAVGAPPSEEAPLKGGGGGGGEGCRGARGVVACFGVLSLAVTVALLAQIYYHDYQEEGLWRGAVAAEARCSQAGGGALLEGGGALDAALAAAVCLAVLRPNVAPLDASGAMLLWHYGVGRGARAVTWHAGGTGSWHVGGTGSWPHALCALSTLHARGADGLARLSLSRLLAPAILLARESSSTAGLADYLSSLHNYTTTDIASQCGGATLVHEEDAPSAPLGEEGGQGGAESGWRVTVGGAGGAGGAGVAALLDQLAASVVSINNSDSAAAAWDGAPTHASGVAIADARDHYVALVLGVSATLDAADNGAGGEGAGAWQRDSPTAPLDLTPIILTQESLCGRRVMVAGGARGAAVSVARALLHAGSAPDLRAAVEAARDGEDGVAAVEGVHAAVNVVMAEGDSLSAHADSRGAGLAHTF